MKELYQYFLQFGSNAPMIAGNLVGLTATMGILFLGLLPWGRPSFPTVEWLAGWTGFLALCGLLATGFLAASQMAHAQNWLGSIGTGTTCLLGLLACQSTVARARRRGAEIQESGALISISRMDKQNIVSVWVKKNHREDWPPLWLELGFNQRNTSAETAPKRLVEKANEMVSESFDSAQIQDLRTVLNAHGAVHPMDIAGADRSEPILNFFQRILLNAET